MIKFKSLSVKNFLSVGNTPITLDLSGSGKKVLCLGKNGSGKSSILIDGITFALFGKSYRNINKPQLVNSINEKDCVAEIEFDIDGKGAFKVIRGIAPSILEIYQNGTIINIDSARKDYQRYLEQHILGMNYDTFTQIVILGSSNYTPFMELKSHQRRDIIEKLLNIQVFTAMNKKLKSFQNQLSAEMQNYQTHLRILQVRLEEQKKLLDKIKTQNTSIIDTKKQEKLAHQDTIDRVIGTVNTLTDNRLSLSKKIKSLSDLSKIKNAVTELQKIRSSFDANVGNKKKTLQFFNTNTSCPVCSQMIDDTLKTTKTQVLATDIEKIEKNMILLDEKLNQYNLTMGEIQNLYNEVHTIDQQINGYQQQINIYNQQIKDIDNFIINYHEVNQMEVEQEEELYQKTATEISKTSSLIDRNIDQSKVYAVCEELLKDTGIKAKMVSKYLPHMNSRINFYLQKLEFYVTFVINENFVEKIKSRHRDTFSYSSFSEGEKLRIDIAILLAWRDIAKLKNSVNTNILILDEILDSSLDTTGTDNFLSIINILLNNTNDHKPEDIHWSNAKTNVFIISHKAEGMVDKFDRVLMFTKVNDFTEVTEVD